MAEVDNPLFVRLYRRMRVTAAKRGEDEHRRRTLAGLRGRVLELGAGDGTNFPLYPPEVTEIVAVEPEPRMRALAEQAARTVDVEVRVLDGLAEDLPLEDASVDAGVASLVLCTVPDQAVALAELHRVIRPGGELRFYEHVHAHRQPLRLFLTAADRSGIWPAIAGGCHPTRETAEAIQAAGFEVEGCERFAFSPTALLPNVPYLIGSARRA